MTLFALALFSTAHAEDANLEAKVKAALVETIEMTSAGDLDGWITKYCDPNRCGEARAREEFKLYQLKQANLKAKMCMNDAKEITVTQQNGDIASGEEVRWYIKCEGRQMPAAMRFRYDKEADRVWFSHLGF
ncbi:MAG: hypothetical protein H6737_28905 [Alphaproteobacteria bacterium]|nr:hypothetical protein [Alphaproteobacteria bacterium]